MVWIAAVLGALFGAWQARKRKGNALDMAQHAAVYGILFAIAALIVNVLILRQGAG